MCDISLDLFTRNQIFSYGTLRNSPKYSVNEARISGETHMNGFYVRAI